MMLLVVDLVAKPGKRGELAEHIHALLGGGAEGLLQYAVGFATHDSSSITLVEEWQDEASHDAFMHSEFFAGFREATTPLNAGPPNSRTFDIDVPAAPETQIISLL